jgi:hypothetical protein
MNEISLSTLGNMGIKVIVAMLFIFIISGFVVQDAFAADQAASITSLTENGEIQMAPGERRTVIVEFQNDGDYTWHNDGWGYVSLYTYVPKYRKSIFDPASWLGPGQVSRIRELAVQPGDAASMEFELHAPMEVGDYVEAFKLAAEDITWIDGGDVVLNITVREAVESAPEPEVVVDQPSPSTSSDSVTEVTEVSSMLTGELALPANSMKAKALKSILYTVGFKNTGEDTWHTYELQAPDYVAAASVGSDFSHPAWKGAQLAAITDKPVAPGETAWMNFAFMAPSVNGNHLGEFTFLANGQDVEGAVLTLPVEVIGGTMAGGSAPRYGGETPVVYIAEEPMLRVGVLIVDEETDWEVRITSSQSAFELRDIDNILISEQAVGDIVTAYYDAGLYFYDTGTGLISTPKALRFIPKTENAVMTVTNFDWRETRGSSLAYNTYRNILELRYNEAKDRTWLINELPMEYYLRGLAETLNSSPMEYQKALLTAARTFAYFHFTHGTKRAEEFMTLVSSSHDQVYKGYGQEELSPNITAAVEATRGQIVTYENEVAITSYFSRSDGSTRNWSDVYWGERAYSIAVPVPCDIGKTMWGHGVGMSASGALCMADEGETWDGILNHFYTGIDILPWWK